MKISPVSFAHANYSCANVRHISSNKATDSVSFCANLQNDESIKKRALAIYDEAMNEYMQAEILYKNQDYMNEIMIPIMRTVAQAIEGKIKAAQNSNGQYLLNMPKSIATNDIQADEPIVCRFFEDASGIFQIASKKYPNKMMQIHMSPNGKIITIQDGLEVHNNTTTAEETYLFLKYELNMIILKNKTDKYGTTFDKSYSYIYGEPNQVCISGNQPDKNTIIHKKDMIFKRKRLEKCRLNEIMLSKKSHIEDEEFEFKKGKVIYKKTNCGKTEKSVIKI